MPEDGAFRRRDVMRARVFVELEAKGLDSQTLASAHASGHLTLGYLESAGRRHPRTDRTLAQFSKHTGVPVDTLQNMYVTLGLPRPGEDEYIREDDEPILNALTMLLGAGVEEGDVLRAVRILGDSARPGRAIPGALFPQHDRRAVPPTGPSKQRGIRGRAQRGRLPNGSLH